MPDADKVHEGLSFRHEYVYKQLCEDVATPRELAYAELEAIKKDVQAYGKAPLTLIQQATMLLGLIPSEPLLKEMINWKELRHRLDKLEQEISLYASPNKRGMNLALEACKQQIGSIQRGAMPQRLDVSITLRYLIKIYEANFEGKMRLAHHHNDADPLVVNSRLHEMRPHLEEGLKKFAEQIVRKGDVASLRRPRRPNGSIKRLSLNDDLLTSGGINHDISNSKP